MPQDIFLSVLSVVATLAIVYQNIKIHRENQRLKVALKKRDNEFNFLLIYALSKVRDQAAETEDFETAAQCAALIGKLKTDARQVEVKSS